MGRKKADHTKLWHLLEEKFRQFNRPDFIPDDPISVPHRFSKLQDIEIAAFWTAILAWGNRKSIIRSATRLFALMDNAPHQFITGHQDSDLKRLLNFKHRTFNATDTLYFLEFLQQHYAKYPSLEDAFVLNTSKNFSVETSLSGFHRYFFSLDDAPLRTRKHISTPERQSACKRLNMFLRWMVRTDDCGVDFGLWKRISPAQLICPLDVHVERVARHLGLITSPVCNWYTALELTESLKAFDPSDPVKYDFALFGLGLEWSGKI